MALASRLTTAASRVQATRMFARSATTAVPAAAQNLPPVSEAEDPQLAGLAYPKVPEVNRQLRPAKTGWWDEQDRWNQSEAVSENEDVLSVWGPDQFPKFPGGQAASYLAIAGLTMAAVTSFIVWSKPERPYVGRTYPYDGLKLEMTGKDDSELPGARSNALREGADEEERLVLRRPKSSPPVGDHLRNPGSLFSHAFSAESSSATTRCCSSAAC